MPNVLLLQRDHEASPHLAARIAASGKWTVVGTLHTVAQARQVMRLKRPEVLMTDLRVQDGEVLGLLDELREQPHIRLPHVLVTLVAHDDAVLLEALKVGAQGYWVHTSSTELLLETLNQLAMGQSVISPSIARALLAHFDRPARRFDSLTEAYNGLVLTQTEREVLQWLAQGYLVEEIATHWHDESNNDAHGLGCVVRRVLHKLQYEQRANRLSLLVV
jgi:DNA-binding NarL/FixJ family response regulator